MRSRLPIWFKSERTKAGLCEVWSERSLKCPKIKSINLKARHKTFKCHCKHKTIYLNISFLSWDDRFFDFDWCIVGYLADSLNSIPPASIPPDRQLLSDNPRSSEQGPSCIWWRLGVRGCPVTPKHTVGQPQTCLVVVSYRSRQLSHFLTSSLWIKQEKTEERWESCFHLKKERPASQRSHLCTYKVPHLANMTMAGQSCSKEWSYINLLQGLLISLMNSADRQQPDLQPLMSDGESWHWQDTINISSTVL